MIVLAGAAMQKYTCSYSHSPLFYCRMQKSGHKSGHDDCTLFNHILRHVTTYRRQNQHIEDKNKLWIVFSKNIFSQRVHS